MILPLILYDQVLERATYFCIDPASSQDKASQLIRLLAIFRSVYTSYHQAVNMVRIVRHGMFIAGLEIMPGIESCLKLLSILLKL